MAPQVNSLPFSQTGQRDATLQMTANYVIHADWLMLPVGLTVSAPNVAPK